MDVQGMIKQPRVSPFLTLGATLPDDTALKSGRKVTEKTVKGRMGLISIGTILIDNQRSPL